MSMHRRTFLAGLGGVAAAAEVGRAGGGTPQAAELPDFDPAAFLARANADGEFRVTARFWNARVRMEIGDAALDAVVRDGRLHDVGPAAGPEPDVRISGPLADWKAPSGADRSTGQGAAVGRVQIAGDAVCHVGPYQRAIQRLVGLVRETFVGRKSPELAADVDREMDSAVGRYRYVRIQGVQYRVYYEEAGQGIPLVLQHTAGSDGRQWRHLLEDHEIQQHFRLIAYDLPYHGKSLPPTGVAWWTQEYKLTTELLMDSVVAICHALELERPVYMGCSVGGYLAPDLALYRPDEFRAVIGVNSGTGRGPGAAPPPLGYGHEPGSYLGATMYDWLTASTAPEPYRRETGWVYSQGGPGVFAGDLHYYLIDHDLTGGQAQGIDTSRVGVHFLTGEFDPAVQGPTGTEALAADIPGSTYAVMQGGSHFAMCDDYPLFREYLLPILDRIRGREPGAARYLPR